MCADVLEFGQSVLARPFPGAPHRRPRIIRLISKWLKAGVLEDGIVTTSETGTGQGSVISPLLANVYLHYVFDLWANRWRQREAKGDMIIVRYADDIVVGFQHEHEARRFWDAMRGRFEEFALSLHPDKTRLMEFGRFAAYRRARRGLGKPETFNFLGFTHISGRSRRGTFQLQRHTRRDRMRARLKEIKEELRRRMHQPIPVQGRWLAQVVRGYFAYHAVPTNARKMGAFRRHVVRLWLRTLRRRSQRRGLTWDRMRPTGGQVAPETENPSPLAGPAIRRQTLKVRTGCGNPARPGLCGGRLATAVPTAIAARGRRKRCATAGAVPGFYWDR